MKRLALLSIMLALPLAVHAQKYAFELSAGADAATTPHTHGDFGVLIGDGVNWSYSKIVARGPSKAGAPGQRFTYSIMQGYQRQIKAWGKLALFTDAEAGVAASTGAVSGAFSTGGGFTYQYRPQIQIVASGRVLVSPADGGTSPAISIGIRFTPGQ